MGPAAPPRAARLIAGGVDLPGYALALGVTLGVEVPMVAAFYPGRQARVALACAVSTTATHLLLHLAFPAITPRGLSPLVAGELFATATEAAVYAAVGRDLSRALVASALANSASFAAGLLLFR